MASGAGLAALAAFGCQLFSRPDRSTYDLSYFKPRPPFPDEREYDLDEGDPGAGYTNDDNAYLLHLLSQCRIPNYTVSFRLLPDGGRISTARINAVPAGREVTCLSRFVDPHRFVALEKIGA
jgi:hypothetical protein